MKTLVTLLAAVAFATSSVSADAGQRKHRIHTSSTHITTGAYSTSTGCLPAQIKGVLNTVNSKFGKIQVVSTFRRGAHIAGTHKISKHASCRAVDFNPAPGSYNAVIKYLRTQPIEIIQYRCAMHHIHIATGNWRGTKCVNSAGIG